MDAEIEKLIEQRAQEIVRQKEINEINSRYRKLQEEYDYIKSIEATVASGSGFVRILVPHFKINYVYLDVHTYTEDGKYRAQYAGHERGITICHIRSMFNAWWEHESRLGGSPRYEQNMFQSPKSAFRDFNRNTDGFIFPLRFDPFSDALRYSECEKSPKFNGLTFSQAKELLQKTGSDSWYRIFLNRELFSIRHKESFSKRTISAVMEYRRRQIHWKEEVANVDRWLRESSLIENKKITVKKSICRHLRRHRTNVSKSAIAFFKMFTGARAITEVLKHNTTCK